MMLDDICVIVVENTALSTIVGADIAETALAKVAIVFASYVVVVEVEVIPLTVDESSNALFCKAAFAEVAALHHQPAHYLGRCGILPIITM